MRLFYFECWPLGMHVHDISAAVNQYVAGNTAWSAEEQAVLESALSDTPAVTVSHLQRCAVVAARLPGKTIRDVAVRLRWLRDAEPAMVDLTVAAMGARTAEAGLAVFDPTSPTPHEGGTGAGGTATWRNPAAMFTGPTAVRPVGAPAPSFPHELAVAQLLQENHVAIEQVSPACLLGVPAPPHHAMPHLCPPRGPSRCLQPPPPLLL